MPTPPRRQQQRNRAIPRRGSGLPVNRRQRRAARAGRAGSVRPDVQQPANAPSRKWPPRRGSISRTASSPNVSIAGLSVRSRMNSRRTPASAQGVLAGRPTGPGRGHPGSGVQTVGEAAQPAAAASIRWKNGRIVLAASATASWDGPDGWVLNRSWCLPPARSPKIASRWSRWALVGGGGRTARARRGPGSAARRGRPLRRVDEAVVLQKPHEDARQHPGDRPAG